MWHFGVEVIYPTTGVTGGTGARQNLEINRAQNMIYSPLTLAKRLVGFEYQGSS